MAKLRCENVVVKKTEATQKDYEAAIICLRWVRDAYIEAEQGKHDLSMLIDTLEEGLNEFEGESGEEI